MSGFTLLHHLNATNSRQSGRHRWRRTRGPDRRRLPQAAAAAILCIDQPKVSALLSGSEVSWQLLDRMTSSQSESGESSRVDPDSSWIRSARNTRSNCSSNFALSCSQPVKSAAKRDRRSAAKPSCQSSSFQDAIAGDRHPSDWCLEDRRRTNQHP